uniref:Ig-like domain-containing protein n=1 Tax=Pelusios castaneus TaxID=367368 RepID=A0A8C8SLG9_9SAUR
MSSRMICLTLLLLFHWAPKPAEAQEHRTVAAGSSVLLTALPTNNTEHIQWEYIRSSTPENIMHYYRTGKEPVIAERYEGRVVFYSSNGSLLLKNVQVSDSGIYRATINLNKIDAKETVLKVIEPVSKPQLQINSTVVGSAVELSCEVPSGKVQAIDWKKDGKPLPRNRCYLLSESFNVLYIPEGQKSDCGSFSCNASNEISWQETSVNLTIEGITPPQKHALTISTVALAIAITLAAGSVLGFLVLCCQKENKKITGELWRWLVVSIHGLVCVSSTLMIIASVLWMREDGLSKVLTFYMILLMWVTMVTLLYTASFWILQPLGE